MATANGITYAFSSPAPFNGNLLSYSLNSLPGEVRHAA